MEYSRRRAVLRRAALVMAILPGCTDSADGRTDRLPLPDVPVVGAVADSSTRFRDRIGAEIGRVMEGRFLGGYVVILDQREPHLKLFTLDGRLRWAGGSTGSAPAEIERAHSIAANADGMLVVLEHGRISEWQLDGAGLAFRRVHSIPRRHFPLGVVSGCDGEWLLYARDQQMFDTVTWQVRTGPEVDWLHSLRLTDSGVHITPIWGEPRDANTVALTGHAAVLIGRTDAQIVVLHRAGAWTPGRILEFDCAGRLARSAPEGPLITGSERSVRLPRTRANQWTSGVAAVGDGWLLPLHRYFSSRAYETGDTSWMTEVFYADRGQVLGSIVLSGQWSVLDYHPEHGVLMAESRPPHFIRIPSAALKPPAARAP